MINECKCKLPYVHSGTDTCTRCQNRQARFLPIIDEKPLSVKRDFNGSEYNPNDIVEVIGKSYACLVEIVNYIPNG